MDLLTYEFSLMGWVVLPLFIFLARVVDVTLGTLRILFVARSMKLLAPLTGFFESLIWLLAIGQIIQSLTNVSLYIAYAAGFAFGNYVGIYIEEKIAMGLLCVRTITRDDATDLIEYLKDRQFGVTSVSASGVSGQVRLILSIIKRKDLNKIISIIREKTPHAFVSVEDVRSVTEGYFPQKSFGVFSRLPLMRK